MFDIFKNIKAIVLRKLFHAIVKGAVGSSDGVEIFKQFLGWIINKHAPILPVKRAVFMGVCDA